ncbi:MAG: helix-turn-helix transcriptional regulator [Thermomicrobiales bacterium]
MRADRLLMILSMLQVQRCVTARDLAERLEVSARTIHRDMEALSIAGVPLYAQRGAGGGWMLPEDYQIDPAVLTGAEVRALFFGQPARLLADLGLDRASDAALVKLLAAIPAMQRADAERARQRIHLDVTGWRRYDEAVPHLVTVQEAIWTDRRLHMTYRRGDGGETVRDVDPLGLVASGSVWYLVAGTEEGTRTYRVSRIVDAELRDEPSDRPPNFDLAAAWAASKERYVEQLPRYHATLRVEAEAVSRVRRFWRYARIEREEPAGADGRVLLGVRFQFEEEACEYVLSLGPRVDVLDPPALRQRVLTQARAVVAIYRTDGDLTDEGCVALES